jgi:hypothetical protein
MSIKIANMIKAGASKTLSCRTGQVGVLSYYRAENFLKQSEEGKNDGDAKTQ